MIKPFDPVEGVVNKDQIIEMLSKRNDVRTFVNRKCYRHPDVKDDLYQELFMSLLKMAPEKIEGIYHRGELHFVIIAIVRNMIERPSSTFYSTYITPGIKNIYNKVSVLGEDGEEQLIDLQVFELHAIDREDTFLQAALKAFAPAKASLYEWDKQLLEKWFACKSNCVQVARVYGINKDYATAAMGRNRIALKAEIERIIEIPDEVIPEFSVYVENKNHSVPAKDIEAYKDQEHKYPAKYLKKNLAGKKK